MGCAELVEVLFREQRLVAYIETYHGERPSGLEDDLRGFGVVGDVGFGGGVDIAAGDRASHDDDFLHERNDGGIFADGERDVSERANRHERDFMRRGVNHFDDEVGGEPRVGLALARGEFDVGKAVLAVPELGGDELLRERMLGAVGDGNIAAVGERDHAESILETLRLDYVSGHDGERTDVEFGRVEREHDGHGVVGAGVGIDDDFFGCGEGGKGKKNCE